MSEIFSINFHNFKIKSIFLFLVIVVLTADEPDSIRLSFHKNGTFKFRVLVPTLLDEMNVTFNYEICDGQSYSSCKSGSVAQTKNGTVRYQI